MTNQAESTRFATTAELQAALPYLDAAPKDVGTLTLVVRRPSVGERKILAEGSLDLAVGLVGDTWADRPSTRTSDGTPHPDMRENST